MGFSWWMGPMLRTHRAGKGLGDFGGLGLGSTEQKGPRCASRLWSQRVGDSTWEPCRLTGLEWVGQMPSAPLQLLWSWGAPPACLSYSAPASLLRPQEQHGLEGASEGIEPGPRSRQTSPAYWAGETLGSLPLIPAPEGPSRRGNPSPR